MTVQTLMLKPIAPAQMYAALANSSALVICANRRLLRHCQQHYGQFLPANKHDEHLRMKTPVWPAPKAYLWEDLLALGGRARLLDWAASGSGAPPECLLSKAQEQRVWEQLIQQIERDQPLLRHRELANLAQEAFAFECRYLLDERELGASNTSAEWQRYRLWRRAFIQRCAQQNWCANSQWQRQTLNHWLADFSRFHHLLGAAQTASASAQQNAVTHIILFGFDELGPDLQRFLSCAQVNDFALSRLQHLDTAAQEYVLRAHTSAQEIAQACAWAATQAMAGKRVALVVPDLSSERRQLERELLPLLHKAEAVSALPLSRGQFNISAAGALAEHPLIANALDLWRLLSQPREWPLLILSRVLRSAHCADMARDLPARARLDAHLRGLGCDQIKVTQFLRLLNESASANTPELALLHTQLLSARALCASWPTSMAPSQWAEYLPQLLRSTGWPGTRTLSSGDWQAQQALLKLCADFALWDEVLPRLSLSAAISELSRQAQEQNFQAQANADAPVQVLGLLEASGQNFDAIWVLRAQDDLLPAPARPNPLLPLRLQQAHDMPRASSEREWRYVQAWRENLRFNTPLLLWSCAQFDEDTPVRLSALVNAIDSANIDDYAAAPVFVSAGPLSSVRDQTPVPVQIDERLRGGVELLKAQARNPLWAFAQFRLRAEALAPIRAQTTPRVHGLLLHAALEIFWQEQKSSERLQALNETQLLDAIKRAVDQACIAVGKREALPLPTQWLHLQRELLAELLQDWLQFERDNRPPFYVQALEQEVLWQHRDWAVRLRIDRIDRHSVEPGTDITIIDYKSGKAPALTPLYQDLMLEPQLPLYALSQCTDRVGDSSHQPALVNTEIHSKALLYAQIKRGDMRCTGLVRDDETWAKLKAEPQWTALQQRWQQQLSALADHILDGEISNQYRHLKHLQFCPVLPFLRINADALEDEQDASNAGVPA